MTFNDPKLWELWYIPYNGNAGFCPSTVVDYRKLGRRNKSQAQTSTRPSAQALHSTSAGGALRALGLRGESGV